MVISYLCFLNFKFIACLLNLMLNVFNCMRLARPWPRPQRGDIVGDIKASQGIDRGGHESTDLDFISTTKIMSILIVCSYQFLVSTMVQVVGIIPSLHAATKISGSAQGIVTVASRWHALMTCSSNDSPHNRSSDSLVNFEAANRLSSLHTCYSESDLESTDYVHVPTNSQMASHMASYHKGQAFEADAHYTLGPSDLRTI
ncbi:uncharacterized protein LOC126593854 isoform X2 [Malus sylvestris]|uniref:uncharacterized protein LOC126593854 isoform X2 n=1 Tax=Malus sylvestris TaxID=3752 RepID=UPI0021ACE552|nr:uncharacterized protein LOC126593854 isoform X2 [Malus sylvestris]